HDWLADGILTRDPDVAGCVLWGLSHSALVEPDAAEEVAFAICQRCGAAIADAYAQAARENPGWSGARSAALVRRDLRARPSPSSAELQERGPLSAELLADLDRPNAGVERSLRRAVADALSAFASHGPKRAHELALSAYALGEESVGIFESMAQTVPAKE